MNKDTPLVLVSNRGPATFEGGEAKRGGGGLVTALKGLVHHRDAVWVASRVRPSASSDDQPPPVATLAPGHVATACFHDTGSAGVVTLTC